MKKILIMTILFLFFLLTDNACDTNVLKAGLGSNDFGIAFVGIIFALLVRGEDKK